VEIFCTHVCKMEMSPVETIPGREVGGIKENDRGSEFNNIYCKNFCKCHNVPPVQ
jgi:hypothetical protein